MLPRAFGDQKGVVMRRRPKGQQKVLEHKNPNRGNLTFVGIICDDTSIQPRLPQILLGNEHVLRVQDMDAVRDLLPSNVYLIRGKSGWVDHVLFAQILEWLRAAVSEIDPNIQILLLVDTSPVHLHPWVLKTAKAHRIRLCFLPALCTWLLQPCDTHLFRKFKAQLAKLFRRFRVLNSMTHVPMPALIRMIIDLIRQVVQGNKWVIAFEHNGYDLHQRRVSERVLVNLEMDVCQRCTSVFPTDEQIINFLPAKRAVNLEYLKSFALEDMPYTPRPKVRPRLHVDRMACDAATSSGDQNQADPHFMMQSSQAQSQTIWAGRLRRLPSRMIESVVSASGSQVVEPPQYLLPAASSSQSCPSLTMQPLRVRSPQSGSSPAIRQPGVLQARAMAMARRRM